MRCYGDYVGEHIGNLTKTHWELNGNIVGSHWEPGKNGEKILPPAPQDVNGKKQGTLSACFGLAIGCMKLLIPKKFVTLINPYKEHPTSTGRKCEG